MRTKPDVYLSKKFIEAADYVREQHADQTRKGTKVPYIAHLLGVSSLVLEYGGDEDQAIAALLHDVIEDCGSRHEPVIRERFGSRVADIVLACTDGTEEDKAALISPADKRANWRKRKLGYLAHLREEKPDALLVSCCDKLHNARAILADIENPGVSLSVFDRFTAGRDGTMRYYHSISCIFTQQKVAAAPALAAVVDQMHLLAGIHNRAGLE